MSTAEAGDRSQRAAGARMLSIGAEAAYQAGLLAQKAKDQAEAARLWPERTRLWLASGHSLPVGNYETGGGLFGALSNFAATVGAVAINPVRAVTHPADTLVAVSHGVTDIGTAAVAEVAKEGRVIVSSAIDSAPAFGGYAEKVKGDIKQSAEVMTVALGRGAVAVSRGEVRDAIAEVLVAGRQPSKGTIDATIELYSRIPEPQRTLFSMAVQYFFPVAGVVFLAMDLQIAQNERDLQVKQDELDAAIAAQDAVTAAAIETQIAEIERQIAELKNDKISAQVKNDIEPHMTPSFLESFLFAFANATNIKRKGKIEKC